eukprot:tig00020723_g13512.t1
MRWSGGINEVDDLANLADLIRRIQLRAGQGETSNSNANPIATRYKTPYGVKHHHRYCKHVTVENDPRRSLRAGLRSFANAQEAEAAGLTACLVCRPEHLNFRGNVGAGVLVTDVNCADAEGRFITAHAGTRFHLATCGYLALPDVVAIDERGNRVHVLRGGVRRFGSAMAARAAGFGSCPSCCRDEE